ncbi:hypothetical protein TIFTF001_011230 [Ficus carica]|uniref:Glutamine amidotransferase type-2 domain-containing protein n=2 Tax=Magnoliopsida TaxID=3398 RepID=A0AA87ZWU2_FICCA|nr:hypothetical protein TIFTF001_011230 [Ficus carica]
MAQGGLSKATESRSNAKFSTDNRKVDAFASVEIGAKKHREMCGIALIISGVRFDLSSLVSDPTPHSEQKLGFSIDNLKAALRRRGPDSLGAKKLFLQPRFSRSLDQLEVSPFSEGREEAIENDGCCYSQQQCGVKSRSFGLPNGRTDDLQSGFADKHAEFHFIGATLQLRGTNPIIQPLVDSSGNILVYNGEIFGGIYIGSEDNDAEILLRALESCGDESGKASVVEVLSKIRGPWSIIYWQESSRTLWFGRDAFGRRSLLVHWPTLKDSQFLLSSVSHISPIEQSSDLEVENGTTGPRFWEELACGIYSMTVDAPSGDGFLVSEVRKHEWTDAMLQELINWERACVEPTPEDLRTSREKSRSTTDAKTGHIQASLLVAAETVLIALRESVRRRSSLHTIFQADTCGIKMEPVPVAVLFSGGLDSMILAALLHECLDPRYGIDLLNVSFDGQFAPDRISAKAGVKELRSISPSRKWQLVEIDYDLSTLTHESKHVMSLISPANTYMDLNIGIALFLAAGSDGWVCEGHRSSNDEDVLRVRYRSKARILLVGSGADEQCAGYGRHRTKYRNGSWHGLNEEMKLDMQRIWKRNLGRDDRCIADNGKEARFPFLDEDVIKVLLDIPLWVVTDLDQPSGTGDKKILREVAQLLGLHEAASLPKRAIQFGSRIARESNRKNFGSNRAANQACAGSVIDDTKADDLPCFRDLGLQNSILCFIQEHWSETTIGSSNIINDNNKKWRAEEAIAGNAEALQALRELITFPILYSREAQTLGLKTSLVRAVVQECGAHLTVISFIDLVSCCFIGVPCSPHSVHRAHTGESEKFLREAFTEASSHSKSGKPSVIFIDEIDALCPRRDSKREQDVRVASQLFTLMDSNKSSAPQVVVVASTNRVDAIDPALRRSGRFDAEIEVTTPREEERFQILKLYTKKIPMDPSVDLQAIAASCNGYVGADLEALCREATMSALKRSSDANGDAGAFSLTVEDWKHAKTVVGPSITRGVTVEIPKVTWEDIGGLRDLKKKLQQAVEWPIKHSASFTRLGISPVRGILLHGPPGCSKTTLAKAAAHASQASFFSLSWIAIFLPIGLTLDNHHRVLSKDNKL